VLIIVVFLITFAIALAYEVKEPVLWLPPIVAAIVGIVLGVRRRGR
jgi:hypothetical protein